MFLCHNSRDKSAVKTIADALELDFGIPHFLDAYSIPAGEAFIPWIERALAESTGCAIFLGANGWGRTHLWEAEMALARARKDAEFRLIPAVLPGIQTQDIQKLGAGTLFRDINWADFSKRLDDTDAIEKFRSALLGEATQRNSGPARLTPYQIRRDAARWAKFEDRDASVLYHGKQLLEAERLARENADILAVGEVVDFLGKSAERQWSFWRNLAVAGFTAAAVVLVVAVLAVTQYLVAEARRVESLSRQLALLARDADGADRQLLIGVQSYRQASTVEAFRTLYEQSVKWRNLVWLINAGQSVETLSMMGGMAFAGLEDGSLPKIDLATGKAEGLLVDREHHGRITVTFAVEATGYVWIGREDGTIDVLRNAASLATPNLKRMRAAPAAKPGTNLRILSLAASSQHGLIIAGTGSGEVIAIDAKSGQKRWLLAEDRETPIAALAANEAGTHVFYGTQNGVMKVLDAASGKQIESIPGFDGGLMLIASQSDGDEVLALSGFGLLTRLAPSSEGYLFRDSVQMPGVLTAAAMISPKGWLALGDGNENLHLRETVGGDAGFGTISPHRSVVRAVAADGSDKFISAADDGMIALWSLPQSYAPASEILRPPIEPSVLRSDVFGRLVAAGANTDKAGLWMLDDGSWRLLADIIEDSITAGGEAIIAAQPDPTPDDGFVPIGENAIVAISMNPSATAIAWTTQAGGVLWRDLANGSSLALLLGRLNGQTFTLALSTDGTQVAVALKDKVYLYRMSANMQVVSKVITAHDTVRSLAFRPDGLQLALGLENGRVEVLQSADGRHLLVSDPITQGPAGGISYDADGNRLLVNGVTAADRRIIIVDASNLKDVVALQVRQAGGSITAQSIAASGKAFATGDLDGQLIIWDLDGLSYVASFDAGGAAIGTVVFDEAKGRLIAASSTAGLLSLPLQPNDLVAQICKKIAPNIEAAFVLSDALSGQGSKPGCAPTP